MTITTICLIFYFLGGLGMSIGITRYTLKKTSVLTIGDICLAIFLLFLGFSGAIMFLGITLYEFKDKIILRLKRK